MGPLLSLLYCRHRFVQTGNLNHNPLKGIRPMTSKSLWDSEALEKAVARLSAMRPAYTSILGFYGPVFTAQAESAAHTSPPAIAVDESTLQMKRREGFSLIVPAAFKVDYGVAGMLLTEICGIAEASGGKLAGAGNALASALAEGVALESLFGDVLDDRGRIRKLAEKMGVQPDLLSLLLYLAIRPSIEIGSRQLVDHLTDEQENRSSCPICGSAPIIGQLDAEGRQWVYCSLCWYRWPVKRMACPFCTHHGGDALEYFYSDDEPEYRVNLCSSCRQYLKVVDVRKTDRPLFMPLEQVVSLHLDIMAAKKGFNHVLGAGIGSNKNQV